MEQKARVKARTGVHVPPPTDSEPVHKKQSYVKKYFAWLRQSGELWKANKFMFAVLLFVTWLALTVTIYASIDIIKIVFNFFQRITVI